MATMQKDQNQKKAIDVEAFVKKASQWIESADGQAAITHTMREATEAADHLRNAQRIDPKSLLEPITV